MDILKPLPIEKWNELKDILKRDWPAYAYYYNYVENSIKWKTKDPSMNVEFYCPNGRTDAGVFLTKMDHGERIVLLFSFEESKDLLREVLRKTSRIDWSDSFICICVHENFRDILRQFLDENAKSKGLQRYKYFENYYYFKSKEDCLKIELQIPKECELKRIDETYVSQIHSVWPNRDIKNPENSLKFLTTIAKLNGGYGLFLKKDNTLVSWILQSHLGGLGMLQTLDEHKGKGYAKIISQALIKYLAEKENLDVTAFIFRHNKSSQPLAESLGFQRVATLGRFHINQ